MNMQKFTQKSLEAIQNAQSSAIEYGNPMLDQQHLLLALLQQEDGLIPQLLQKMNVNVNGLTQTVEKEVKKMPRVSGGQTRVAVDVEKTLTAAEKLAENMTDEYVSVEHIFMAMVNAPNNALKEIFRQYNVNKEDFMKMLATVRGNTRVTSDSPEATYDALKKYGTDKNQRQSKKKIFNLREIKCKVRTVLMRFLTINQSWIKKRGGICRCVISLIRISCMKCFYICFLNKVKNT